MTVAHPNANLACNDPLARGWRKASRQLALQGVLAVRSGYDFVRILVAAVLLSAAGLKWHQLTAEPLMGEGVLDSRWFLMAVVEFELFFGMWLLGGLLPKASWTAAVACFILFACASLHKALGGAISCGCFGQVEIKPSYTFVFDLVVVSALLRWRPPRIAGSNLALSRTPVFRAVRVGLVWLAVGVPAAVSMGTYQPALTGEKSVIESGGRLVIVEPRRWLGQRFPLLKHIDVGDRLANGDWIVVLYREGCPECDEVVEECENLANNWVGQSDLPCIALIAVPPYEAGIPRAAHCGSCCAVGRLEHVSHWWARTPVVLLLTDGDVRRVSSEAPRRAELWNGVLRSSEPRGHRIATSKG